MHSFTDLVDRSTNFNLEALREMQLHSTEALQMSGATSLVKTLQMIQLQEIIISVGMFSIFEAQLQDDLGCKDGFLEARRYLERAGEIGLLKRFLQFCSAINVLKHGRGRSYDALLEEIDDLPFRLKRPGENFFSEGDVSEVSALIEVDDPFVLACANVIREVSGVVGGARL